jgi:hypothetical protein
MTMPKVHISKPLGCMVWCIARQLWPALSNERKIVLADVTVSSLPGSAGTPVDSNRWDNTMLLGSEHQWGPLAFGLHAIRICFGPTTLKISRDASQCGSGLYGRRLNLLGERTLILPHFLFGGQHEKDRGDHDGSVGKELHKSWSLKSRQSAATKARRIGSSEGILRSARHIGWLISVRKATCDAYAYTCESFLTTFWPARRSRAGWHWYEFGFLLILLVCRKAQRQVMTDWAHSTPRSTQLCEFEG